MGYGVDKVVGGFSPFVRHPLPYAIARTLIEHKDLSHILASYTDLSGSIAEFGCGYGRLMSLSNVGFERDDELRAIALSLGHDVRPFPITGKYSTGITFTFLQHLEGEELNAMCKAIGEAVTDTLILCEAVPPEHTHQCTGRSSLEYSWLFPDFELVATQARRIEQNRQGTGQYNIFKRK